ncbi:hypothetical protein ACTXJG_09995 [Glutamicibacter arilaitensis]|uniref:hypothetical protein n=1 Tax=Glutamicibacter arilaitensis TaxID=256701 RepID=UPI003FD14C3F
MVPGQLLPSPCHPLALGQRVADRGNASMGVVVGQRIFHEHDVPRARGQHRCSEAEKLSADSRPKSVRAVIGALWPRSSTGTKSMA